MSPAEAPTTWESAVQWLIDQPDQRELVEACYFDSPHDKAVERYHRSDEWRAVQGLLGPARGRALDLGAGNGIASFALASDGWSVTAVEPDPSLLVGSGAIRRLAAERQLDIGVVEAFGESLPLETGAFDLVVARQVLHHARSLDGLCREIFRLLKPGGRLVALRDHVVDRPEDMANFFDRHPLHNLYGGENAFTPAQYRNALQAAGFVIDREFGSIDSPINLAPLTPADLHDMVARKTFGIGRLLKPLFAPALFWKLAPLLSKIDRRPGRLVSFACTKPR